MVGLMPNMSCFDCKNCSVIDSKCLKGNSNYLNSEVTDLSECFEKNKLHESLDRVESILEKLNEVLDRR